tara:strand:+ start:415 stop:606 length:192 start_codon:yes stop_codon:yes gene_type:complete
LDEIGAELGEIDIKNPTKNICVDVSFKKIDSDDGDDSDDFESPCMMDPDIPKFTPFDDDGGLI